MSDQRTHSRGWWLQNRWLMLRRVSQLSILVLFLLGPWAGVWIVKGNLTSSLTLEVLPLTDPFILLQSIFAGNLPEATALIGAAIVMVFYALVAGRIFCSWVCPVNLITDLAAWLRDTLGIKANVNLARSARYWLLGVVMVLAAISGVMVWEWVNPVSMFHRALFFGMGAAWIILSAVFLFDLLIAQRGWCGHLCPMGAFYSLLSVVSLLRISARDRQYCDDCMDCFRVCPESQVIRPALKGEQGSSPVILAINCNNCGRCIDVCDQDVFHFSTRFDHQREVSS